MSISLKAVVVLLGVVTIELGILWYLLKNNFRLREENRAARVAIDRVNNNLKDMEELIGDLKRNSQEAADEKRRVDEVENSDLINSANALFPGKLSDD